MKITYDEFKMIVQEKVADIQAFLNNIDVESEELKSDCIVNCMIFEDMVLEYFKDNLKE